MFISSFRGHRGRMHDQSADVAGRYTAIARPFWSSPRHSCATSSFS